MIRLPENSNKSSKHRSIESSEFASLLTHLLPATPFAVAVSGGPDSMALSLLAKEWADTRGVAMLTLTVDHSLRPESAEEAQQVTQWMKARNIPHYTLRWQPDMKAGNRQARAREARYALITEWCKKHGLGHLLTAHHRDDQAETLLLRLKRGSHVRGLAGMRAMSERDGITLIRPLLAIPKARLTATLEALGQPWIEDPSNASPAYDRNRLRRLLAHLPERECITEQLAESAARLNAWWDGEEHEISRFLAAHARITQEGAVCEMEPMLALAQERQGQVLSALLERVGNRPHPPRYNDLVRLRDALTSCAKKRRTLHGCMVTRHENLLIITRESPRSA